MLRLGGKVAFVLVVVSIATVAALASPPESQAFGEPSPFSQLKTGGTSSSLWSAFKGLVSGRGSLAPTYGTLIGGESAATKAGVKTMMYRAAFGGRFLPVLGTVGGAALIIGGGAYIGWRIYSHYNGNDQTIDLWVDSSALGKDSLANPASVPGQYIWNGGFAFGYAWDYAGWQHKTGSAICGVAGSDDCWVIVLQAVGQSMWGPMTLNTHTDTNPEGTWNTGDPAQFPTRVLDHDVCTAAPLTWSDCFTATGASGWSFEDPAGVTWLLDRTMNNLAGRTFGGYVVTVDTGTIVKAGQPVPWRRLLVPEDAFGPGLAVTADSGDTLASPQVTTDYNVPSDAGTTAGDATKMVAAFDSVCGRALINHLLRPSLYSWPVGCIENPPAAEPAPDTITVLRPMANETYTEYIARLQAEGWLGTATLVELDPADPTVGPEAVSKVSVTGKTGAWYRSTWPVAWPQVSPTTDLTLYHNPNTAAAVPADPTDEETPPGGGDVYDPGGCEPWLTAEPDFTPLTSLSVGNKFPFGLFAWVGGVLGSFSVVADAPNWTFDIVIPATSVSAETDLGEFTVDLAWADSYMSTVRLILTFVLWIGAVWYFATALLGLRAPGNPAEAVDDA